MFPSRVLVAALAAATLGLASAPASAHLIGPAGDAVPAATTTGVALESADDVAAASRPPTRKVPKRRPTSPRPDPRRPQPVARKVNPAYAGLAAAAGGGGGTLIGATTVGISALAFFGAFGAPTLPVSVTAAVIGIAAALGTPILAGIGGGGAILLMDPRTKPGEWTGLIQCATSGCCAGTDLIGGGIIGSICGTAPNLPGNALPGIPGPDKPAEWTAGAAIAGLAGGTVVGGLIGWSMAPVPDQPIVPITVGALGGAVVGAAVAAGVGGGVAEAIRR